MAGCVFVVGRYSDSRHEGLSLTQHHEERMDSPIRKFVSALEFAVSVAVVKHRLAQTTWSESVYHRKDKTPPSTVSDSVAVVDMPP